MTRNCDRAPDNAVLQSIIHQSINLSISQSNYFIVRPKDDQRSGQLSLSHIGITKTEKYNQNIKTDEQINPVNGLEP